MKLNFGGPRNGILLIIMIILLGGLATQFKVTASNQYNTEIKSDAGLYTHFSLDQPILDGHFSDGEWPAQSLTTFEIWNLEHYSAGHVADMHVYLVSTPNGLYVGVNFSLLIDAGLILDAPGLLMTFDENYDGQLTMADDSLFLIQPGGFELEYSTGFNPTLWKDTDMVYSRTAEVNSSYLVGDMTFEIYIPLFASTSTMQTIGWDIGFVYVANGYTQTRMVYGGSIDAQYDFSVIDDFQWNAHGMLRTDLNIVPYTSPDIYPPTITLIEPIQSVNSQLYFDVMVTDSTSIDEVYFSDDDGTTWSLMTQNLTLSEIYHTIWDHANFTGDKVIFRAIDANGNIGTLYVVVDTSDVDPVVISSTIIDNSPPLLFIIHPTPDTNVNGMVDLEVQALDASGVASVSWKTDADTGWKNLNYDSVSKTWKGTWDTSTYPDGPYQITFSSMDNLDNSAEIILISSITVTSKILVTETVQETHTENVTNTETLPWFGIPVLLSPIVIILTVRRLKHKDTT